MPPILTTLVTAAGLALAGQALANGPCSGTVTFGEGDTRIAADITTGRNGAGESALGDVITDAQLAATTPVDKGGAVVAFMNPAGIRTNLTFAGSAAGEGDGSVTYGEAFTVQPFGNSLVVKTLTRQQIYDLLRQQWVQGQFPDGGRTLQVSNGFTYRHTFVPNVSPMVDPAAEPGKTYACPGTVAINGVPLDPAASYRVAMNSFLATGGDGYSVFNLGTDQLGGDVDLDAMEAYFRANPQGVAPGPQNRIQQVADWG
jgi:5'-nucleotidase